MTEPMKAGWDLDADVVVVGAGGAGLMAALAAADQEAVVIVLEKAENVGGKSGIQIPPIRNLSPQSTLPDTMRPEPDSLLRFF